MDNTQKIDDWTSVLNQARSALQTDTWDDQEFQLPFQAWTSQMDAFLSLSSPPKNDDQKRLVLQTRASLRFAICCLSSEEQRTFRQTQFVSDYRWHVPLADLLRRKIDSKCHLFAARLLSNLITSNETACQELVSHLPISPPPDDLRDRVRQSTMEGSNGTGSIPRGPATWVDMLIVSASYGRENLAALTAALHNCVVALPLASSTTFAASLANDPMLVTTLLRHWVSVQTIRQQTTDSTEETSDDWDAATEWIYLFLVKLLGLGLLPDMYRAIGPSAERTMIVLPEQIVLLHCVSREAHCFNETTKLHPLGQEGGLESLQATLGFLVDLISVETPWEAVTDDQLLVRTAVGMAMDILAVSLGVEHPLCASLRLWVGAETSLIATLSCRLGEMVDRLTERSQGISTRDLKLSSDEQEWMTASVRLLGNLCYHCRPNQDKMRTTMVPPSKAKDSVERSSLHILLSSTAFGISCFTLREWGVLAIRNILEENPENQAAVAALDAQNPAPSTGLPGVKVTLEANGKVSFQKEEDKASN